MGRSAGGAVPKSEPSSAIQGRWVWKQVFEPWMPPPSVVADHPSSGISAGTESKEPVPQNPRLVSIGGGCWFRGDATQTGEMVSPSLSHNEIADRLSSTSESPQRQNKAPTPDSASAAAMLSKRRESETQVRPEDQRPMSLPAFNHYVAADGV